MMLKILALAVIMLAISSAGALASYNIAKYFEEKNDNNGSIEDFEEGIASRNVSIEFDPVRCIDSNGTVFLQNLP